MKLIKEISKEGKNKFDIEDDLDFLNQNLYLKNFYRIRLTFQIYLRLN